jgi:hypothetical protein
MRFFKLNVSRVITITTDSTDGVPSDEQHIGRMIPAKINSGKVVRDGDDEMDAATPVLRDEIYNNNDRIATVNYEVSARYEITLDTPISSHTTRLSDVTIDYKDADALQTFPELYTDEGKLMEGFYSTALYNEMIASSRIHNLGVNRENRMTRLFNNSNNSKFSFEMKKTMLTNPEVVQNTVALVSHKVCKIAGRTSPLK